MHSVARHFRKVYPTIFYAWNFTNSHFFTDFDAIGDNFARLLI